MTATACQRATASPRTRERRAARRVAGIAAVYVCLLFGALVRADTPAKFHSSEFKSPEACGECHPRHYLEWRGSAHAYSTIDPIFRACNLYAHEQTKGKIGSLCIGCHAPIGALTGELAPDFKTLENLPPVLRAGVSCDHCHRMEPPPADVPIGNASFRLAQGAKAFGRLLEPRPTPAHQSVHSDFLGSSEYCGSCHDVLQNGHPIEKTYAEWVVSEFKSERNTQCQDCHMVHYAGQAAVDGPFRERLHRHNFPAVTVPLIPFPNSGYQRDEVQAFLRTAARLLVDVESVAPAGGTLLLTTRVKNIGAGHNLPSGLSAFRQMWLEVMVKDDRDTIIFHSGRLDKNGDLFDANSDVDPRGDPQLVSFTDQFVNEKNEPVQFFFEANRVIEHALRPLEERTSVFKIPVESALRGRSVRARIRLLFRPYPPHGLRFLGLDHLVEKLPIWVMDTFTSEWIRVEQRVARRTDYSIPEDFPDLHAALRALRSGDRVRVGPGTYLLQQPLDFRGKDIELVSVEGAARTVLKLAKEQSTRDAASVVVFQSGEGRGSRLEGFTILGGRGTLVDGSRRGGGIYVFRSNPTIVGNRIEQCGATLGGGILYDGGEPILEHNEIADCWAERGGALAIRNAKNATVTLRGLALEGNVANLGGAIYIEQGTHVRLRRTLLSGNRARQRGGAIFLQPETILRLDHCTVILNHAQENGGSWANDSDTTIEVTNSIIWDNQPQTGAALFRYSMVDSPTDSPTNVHEGFPLFRDPSGSWERRRDRTDPDIARSPLRRRWASGRYRLLPGSPAIDRGDPTSLADPDDSRNDMGAFFTEQPLKSFVRGDVDGDGNVGWPDLVLLSVHLQTELTIPCLDAADVDDSGNLTPADMTALGLYLFGGRLIPAAPFPRCGLDPTLGEGLACDQKATPCPGLSITDE